MSATTSTHPSMERTTYDRRMSCHGIEACHVTGLYLARLVRWRSRGCLLGRWRKAKQRKAKAGSRVMWAKWCEIGIAHIKRDSKMVTHASNLKIMYVSLTLLFGLILTTFPMSLTSVTSGIRVVAHQHSIVYLLFRIKTSTIDTCVSIITMF